MAMTRRRVEAPHEGDVTMRKVWRVTVNLAFVVTVL
jgi:hypothetical protein